MWAGRTAGMHHARCFAGLPDLTSLTPKVCMPLTAQLHKNRMVTGVQTAFRRQSNRSELTKSCLLHDALHETKFAASNAAYGQGHPECLPEARFSLRGHQVGQQLDLPLVLQHRGGRGHQQRSVG